VIGMVLAAGAGRRLEPLTKDLPKTLLPVDGDRTILDVALRNLRDAGMEEVVVITGFASHRIEERKADLEAAHDVRLELVFNDKALEWNNAYSLWCARDHFDQGVLLCNGDTVHPASVEHRLLEARGDDDLVLAVDDEKTLGEEEMKVQLGAGGALQRITKLMDPRTAAGEYIGATLIEGSAAQRLADALEATFTRDPGLYYEDAYQELVDRGGVIDTVPIPPGTSWVEVDNHADLSRAREIACRY
jgi:choline kinase